MDKRKILHEAAEWFLATFPGLTTYETAYGYAEWTLYAVPFIKTEEHLLFAAKLIILVAIGDDSFKEHEYVMLLNYLKTSVANEASPFISAIIKYFDDYKAVSIYEENYNNTVKTIVAFFECTVGMKSNDKMDRITDSAMLPFYIISLDSNHILADMNNEKLLDGAYATRIDNDLLTYPKDTMSGYMLDHANPVYAGVSIGDQLNAVKSHCTAQLLNLEPTLEDAIYLQGRMGCFVWSLFTKRYGCILKTVYEDNQTVENIRKSIKKSITISDKKNHYL
ncbi:uncharacterized protein BX664DRAFT_313707 [Halteromyces radiatus]|uniref:uncharacterized protein n=1 Tax=Halteromyces radiatus TaxID=101107 RepID=UPI0022207AA7|nr:uncharacterized protein BX664DRAFT_313707 [Halteromyces radiatus]KAI8093684.1 hypothetical protein BX664DRAFT_313707 [Halteromyces radiatus]